MEADASSIACNDEGGSGDRCGNPVGRSPADGTWDGGHGHAGTASSDTALCERSKQKGCLRAGNLVSVKVRNSQKVRHG
jgi:hypothetical protein